MRSGTEYVIVWEFRVRQEKEQEFVEKYDPEGAWVRFFRSSERYIRTELVHDVVDRSRFLTLDYWFLRWTTGRQKQILTIFKNDTWPSTTGWTESSKA